MTGSVTESIWNGVGAIIPLADVQHIETAFPRGIVVVTRHTRWDHEAGYWANSIFVDAREAGEFKAAWYLYRSRFEAAAAANREPHDA